MGNGYPWFRLYDEVLHDRKLTRIAKVTGNSRVLVLGAWVGLLALANDSPERGRLLLAGGVPLTAEDIALEIDIDFDVLNEIMAEMQRLDMLGVEAKAFFVAQWPGRQFESDSSTERVRRYREKQKETLQGNEDATLQGRDGNAPEQSRTDTDKKRVTRPKKAPAPVAVQAYREIVNRFPDKATWPLIAKTVGEAEDDLQFWKKVVTAWIGCGWNKLNVSGMMECYQRREVPGTKGGKRGAHQRDDRRRGNLPPSETIDREMWDNAKCADRADG